MEIISRIITKLINPAISLLFAAAIIIFFWGIIDFIWNADNEKKVTQGKQHIIWGLVGLLIMFAVSGILQIIKNFVQF